MLRLVLCPHLSLSKSMTISDYLLDLLKRKKIVLVVERYCILSLISV